MATATRTRRRRLSADQRRSRVLAAAVSVFAERGYAAASMVEIARRSGVVASVIYDHFPSKRDLYLELLELHGQALIERSVSGVPDAPPRDRLRLSLEAFYEFVEDDPFVWRFLFRDPPADPDIARAYHRIRDRATEAIASVLESEVAPDTALGLRIPRRRAARMFAEAARAATDGLAGWWYANRDVPREQVVAIAMGLLWEGFAGLTGDAQS
jgi:AcrR family transcriptional regulator